MFNVCSDVVETRKKSNAGLDTTRMLNELLADDSWLETVSISEFFYNVFNGCNFCIFAAIPKNARFVGGCGYICSVKQRSPG